ncbi:hypothetical protein PALB_6820 [Pseudoalteromonas luteoviolacea B = ATCC 29581]|nr:hypothetical protein PALB_6820 [Pseudoalteromonas luteoviolacea B = ATCC 29581]
MKKIISLILIGFFCFNSLVYAYDSVQANDSSTEKQEQVTAPPIPIDEKAKDIISDPNSNIKQKDNAKLYGSILLTIVIIGTIAGAMRKTVIFLDFDDLGYSFGILAVPVAMLFIFNFIPVMEELKLILLTLPSLILIYLAAQKSWQGGVRLMMPIVLITKVTWGVLFILAILNILNPSGKNAKQRRQNRALAMIFAMVATPIIARLVVNKEGRFFSPDMISKRGVSGVSNIRNGLKK